MERLFWTAVIGWVLCAILWWGFHVRPAFTLGLAMAYTFALLWELLRKN